jgi:superfamily II DNA or RNA helicase
VNLRPYQADIIEAARAKMRAGCKRLIITAPTGSGKTVLTAFMLREAANKGKRSFFCVHRRELLHQSEATFQAAGIDYGVIAAGRPEDPSRLVQICTVQTLAKRLSRHTPPHLVVWDESHHNAARTWQKVHAWCGNIFHVGLTATIIRLDGTGLRPWFDDIVFGPTVSDLIAEGYLADYRLFCPATVDMRGVRRQMGDYAKGQTEGVVNRPTITGKAVAEYRRHCNGKRAIVFTVSVKHAKDAAEAFNDVGISAEAVDGNTPKKQRDAVLTRFRNSQTRVLCNCELFTEGFDVPDASCAIVLRPTASVGLWLQMVGRVFRPKYDDSHAIILDHVGNAGRHGLPDDERIWTLDGIKPQPNRPTENAVRICKTCFAACPIAMRVCRYCGSEFIPDAREVAEVEGQLEEFRKEDRRRTIRMEQGRARTFPELIEVGKMRGVKNPRWWALAILRGRKRKNEQRKSKGTLCSF